MTVAVGRTTGTGRPRTGLKNVCAAAIAATVVAAGVGATLPSAPHVGRVVHLEATLAASVISTVANTVASVSEPAGSNSLAAARTPTASAVATSGTSLNLGQALLFTAAAALLTPAWYIGFPVTIPLSAAATLILVSPFVVGAGGSINLGIVAVAAVVGAIIYALLPPAAILGGLVNVWEGLSQTLSQPSAATKAKAATRSGEAPTSTGHSGRVAAGLRGQSNTAARTTASAAKSSSNKNDQSRASSKKSTTGKRTVGGSGRDR